MKLKQNEKFLCSQIDSLILKFLSEGCEKFSHERKEKELLMPFLQALGYDISNKKEFIKKSQNVFYVMKNKKIAVEIKFDKITDEIYDFQNNIFKGSEELFEQLKESFEKTKAEYIVFTDGLVYLFFTYRSIIEEIQYCDQCFFSFNFLSYNPEDTGMLNVFSKDCVFGYLESKSKRKKTVLKMIGSIALLISIIFFVSIKIYGII